MKIRRNPKMRLLQAAKSRVPLQILSPPTWDPIPHQCSCHGVQVRPQNSAAAKRKLLTTQLNCSTG